MERALTAEPVTLSGKKQVIRGLRRLLVIVALAVTLVPAGAAWATAKMPLGYAHHQSARFTRELCERQRGCESARITTCVREARSRVDCAALSEYNESSTYCTYIVVNEVVGTALDQRTRHVVCR